MVNACCGKQELHTEFFTGKSHGKRLFEKLRCRWLININMDHTVIMCLHM
jgi:hypothetical protein